MAAIVLPDVAEVLEAVRAGVVRRLGKKRKLYTGEDLIDDVGLSAEQFDDLIAELEGRFEIEFDPETVDQLTPLGALVIRLLRLCSQEIEGEELERHVA